MNQKFTLFAALILFFSSAFSQAVTNGGFETWTGSPSHPTGWCDPESLAGLSFGLLTKDQTVSGHLEGSSAVKLKTDSVQTPFGILLLNGFISLGTGYFNSGALDPADALNYYGAAFAFRPDSIKFSYKYAPVANDQAEAAIYFTNAGTDVGGGSFYLSSTSGNWVTETQAIPYATATIPDTLFLFFNASTDVAPSKNSTLWIDAVSFIYNQTGLGNEISSTVEITVGPNPANVNLNLFSEKNILGNSIQIFDVQGKLLSTSMLTKNQIDISTLQNGNYILNLVNTEGKILKGRFSVMK